MTTPPRILIIDSDYYPHITGALLEGASDALGKAAARVDRVTVPGVLEIPAALAMAVAAGGYDGYVLLGCVIRGETSHYDIVAGDSARAVMDLSVAHRLALGNAILTVENEKQALARARLSERDKGGDAARAALAMIAVRDKLKGEGA